MFKVRVSQGKFGFYRVRSWLMARQLAFLLLAVVLIVDANHWCYSSISACFGIMAPRVPEYFDRDHLLLFDDEEEAEDPALISTVLDDFAPNFVPRMVTPPPLPSFRGITAERLYTCLTRPGFTCD